MSFTEIDMANWPRRDHFDYYTNIIKTNYEITVSLDVTKLRKRCKRMDIRFYPAMLYAIMRGINQNENFRMAYNEEGKLGFYSECHPSYTIFHEDDETFSDIWSEWDPDFDVFYEHVIGDMNTYKDMKGVKTKPDKPAAFVPISCVPWVNFTHVSHDTTGPRDMYFPIIVFGKYHKEGERYLMPLSLMINHAAADGYHSSKLINEIQDIIKNCKDWMI